MTSDELTSESVGLLGRLPDRATVIDTVRVLCYLIALVGGLSLLVTLELFVRL